VEEDRDKLIIKEVEAFGMGKGTVAKMREWVIKVERPNIGKVGGHAEVEGK
jgi:hypothetical protein